MSKKGLYIGGHSKEYGSPKMGYLGGDPFAHMKQGSPIRKAAEAAKKKAAKKAAKAKKKVAKPKSTKTAKPKIRSWRQSN